VTEVFFKEAKEWKDVSGTQPPPAIKSGNVSFMYIKRNGLFFVISTKFNVSPLMIIELLSRLAGLFKDYCGVLNEETLRMNFTLAYEIIDEAIDYGYPQSTSTEMLKSYIYNEPVAVDKPVVKNTKLKTPNTIPSTAAERPISSTLEDKRKVQSSEVFVDLFEKLTVVIAANGNIVRSSIDGKLQIKSFLSSNPEIRMGLNEDLVISEEGPRRQGYGLTALDDCKFHECVDLTDFERDRIIVIHPPHGEFTAMTYCISREVPYGIPFQLMPFVNVIEEAKTVEINLSLRSEVPPSISAVNVAVRLNIPKFATSLSCDPLGSGERYEYKQQDKQFTWHLKKILGGTSSECKIKVLVSEVTRHVKKEIGSICLQP
jgi:AP-4 complex subunit mu-1